VNTAKAPSRHTASGNATTRIATMNVGSLLSQAGDPVHLNREKAITSLEESLSTKELTESRDTIEQLQNGALTMARSDQWEQRLGAMRIAAVLISHHAADPAFLENAIQMCSDRLEDSEVRVRLAVGQVLKALSAEMGTVVWEKTSDRILSSIRENFVSIFYMHTYIWSI
jgi:hypothetical protein